MKRTFVKDIFADKEAFGGKSITVAGWARSIRSSNVFGFIELNDGSCFKNVQVVFEAEKLENYKEIARQNVGAARIVTGTLTLTPEAPQPFEIKAEKIEVEGTSTPDYPIQKKRHTLEFLRTISYLRPRANLFNAVFRVRSAAAFAIHKFFNENGFIYVNTPLITVSDCEGAGEMFRVTALDLDNPPRTEDGKIDFSKDFFGKSAYLTVSGQLNAECFAQAYSKIYTFGPTFRAEKSYTQRHAAEFWMIEPEIAFSDLEDDMELAEAMTKYVINYVLENCSAELEFFNKFIDNTLLDRLRNVVENDFARITYTEAIKLLCESIDVLHHLCLEITLNANFIVHIHRRRNSKAPRIRSEVNLYHFRGIFAVGYRQRASIANRNARVVVNYRGFQGITYGSSCLLL